MSNNNKIEYVKIHNIMVQRLIKSALQFVSVTLEFVKSHQENVKLKKEDAQLYIKEMLHSVLFLLYINKPSIEPQEFMSQRMLESFRRNYSDVLEKYKTHLPLRPPYSILLDLVVKIMEHDQEDEMILDCLWDLNEKMLISGMGNEEQMSANDFAFSSRVVSCCYFSEKSTDFKTRKYFGASVACKGKIQREVFIDVACVKTWHPKVAIGVVNASTGNETLQLPEYVYSTAYRMKSSNTTSCICYKAMPPCPRCLDIFPNIIFSPEALEVYNAKWEHGNCAECESVSNLLKAERDLEEAVAMPLSNNRINRRQQRLIENLRNTRFLLRSNLIYYDSA
ncbi:uncharacterized protein LOC114643365 [Erpetoichthys calabaricus]|uniref:uncharacterized protein LOC114643365 n=1 Tax=Erpetoichthys calabaricus TaxID=27687 RepID=UPI0010A0BCAE|nr:uncharacterized protein LOC114643365 [Erpetoichthys calabaricus]